MSGIDEQHDAMPKCECGNFKTWVVLERFTTGTERFMWINVDDYLKLRYGKWHFVHDKDVTMMERVFSMYCSACNVTASSEDFTTAMKLFRREDLDRRYV